jgi:TRAP-type C4-dicarboxylate transport system permease small subunit
MRRLAAAIVHIPELIAGATMLAVTGILFSGVVWRYFLVDPLPWTDEVARMLFVWLAFIGAALGVKRGLHASVALLSQWMPPLAHRALMLFGCLVVAAVAFVLVYVGVEQTVSAFSQVMPVTGISKGWTTVVVPISGVLMFLYLAPRARQILRSSGGGFAHLHGPIE